ncbi:Variant-specific surface protein [Giardia duodenalis]|uniref:Variant-specific surface protein n=1 Tax=Giardia intestinalis TaxID=5741 RepID=V6U3R5_GIAIN|nr:Variant-specific surface protein [Giardia intestinalis]
MLAIYLAVGALAAVCKNNDNNCVTGQCDTVGGTEICTRCEATYVPINGKCALAADSQEKCKNADNSAAGEQTCGKCLSTTFMYKGGCYDSTVPPGNVICSEAGSTAGQCETCADGYFKNSGASPTSDSCSECDPTCLTCSTAGVSGCKSCKEGYFLGATSGTAGKCIQCSSKTEQNWPGVESCAKCTSSNTQNTPATCTECAENYYLKTNGATSCVTAEQCGEGFFATTVENIKKCVSCGDATNGVDGCEKCTAPAQGKVKPTCTKCTGKYLKTAPDGTTTCIEKNACTNDFFPVDDSSNGHKCVSCGDTTGVTVDTNKNYVGVANCAKCNAPQAIQGSSGGTATATCTECAAGFLHTSSEGATSCVETCPEGYFEHTASNTKKKTCQSCATANSLNPSVTGIPGCASCTYTEGDTSVLTCSECEQGKKPSLDGKSCNTCSDSNCAFCNSQQVCEGCNSGYILDGAACTQQTCSTPDCKTCTNPKTANEACTACVSTHYLTPTAQCIADCAALSGYHGDADKTCKRCDPSCADCVGAGANQCSACPAGRALKYTQPDTPSNGGSCGEQCAVSADGCADCGAQIGGTAYCSRCTNTQQAPLNGDCAANSRAAFCQQVSNGACTQCKEGYFLRDGGCYQIDRQPGKSVCTAAQGGKCTTCANGLTADNGSCGVCHASCATCSAAGDASKCKTCATGYYKTGTADGPCKPCSQGLAGCRQCTATSCRHVPVPRDGRRD